MSVGVTEKDLKTTIQKAVAEHGATREAIIPILGEVNRSLGYIPPETFAELKEQLHEAENPVTVAESQLLSIASFYHMFSTKPLGKHVIRFCESAPCHVMGGRELFKAIKDTLHLEPGQTSSDKKWSFITTSCLGVCGVGPVMLVDGDIYGNVRPEQVPEILAAYK